MLCDPTLRLLVVKVATDEPLSAMVASVVVPSLKMTLPVAVGDTVAVSVTLLPTSTVAGLAVKPVVVTSFATFTPTESLVLPLCVVSP